MKIVINSVVYDTDTAELVYTAVLSNTPHTSDFKYREAELYKTKKGRWFLRHYGGPMTDMANIEEDGPIGWSYSIDPITADDALGFLLTHGQQYENPQEYGVEILGEGYLFEDAEDAILSHFPDFMASFPITRNRHGLVDAEELYY